MGEISAIGLPVYPLLAPTCAVPNEVGECRRRFHFGANARRPIGDTPYLPLSRPRPINDQ